MSKFLQNEPTWPCPDSPPVAEQEEGDGDVVENQEQDLLNVRPDGQDAEVDHICIV